MKIVSDRHIPFLADAVYKEWPQVQICPMNPDEITPSSVREADILVVRTRTKVNGHLLTGSQVRLVCTATIGFDHIDTVWCERHGIRWISCPGCNAQAVCDYIEETLSETQLFPSDGRTEKVLGIVGVGHVGLLVAQMAERKGMKVLLNDPPKGIGVSLDKSEGIEPFIGGRIADCDIITFHTPLTKEGRFPTFYLCDETFLRKCKPDALIINAARGGIVDEEALLASGHPFVLDTWENEPDVNPSVVEKAMLASMHIAGYSVQGKRNATQMCLDAIAEQFNLPKIDISDYRYTDISTQKEDSAQGWLRRVSNALKQYPTGFEALRKAYPLRGE